MQQTRGRQMEAVFSCMWVSSLVKVYPDQMPQEMAEKSLVALKKESVSVQIAYRYAGEREEFGEVKMQLLREGKEISSPGKEEETAFRRTEAETIRCKKEEETAPRLRIRQVNLVPCAYPCHPKRDEDYDRTKPGLYPDLLRKIPEEGFPLIPGQYRALWLDVDVPEGAPAGRYEIRVQLYRKPSLRLLTPEMLAERRVPEGELRLPSPERNLPERELNLPETEPITEMKIRLEVLPGVLPELPIRHTEWFHVDALAQYYQVPVFSEEHWNLIRSFIRTAVRNHCNMILTPVFTPPLDTAVGGERTTVQLVDVAVMGKNRYRFGFEKLLRWIRLCREEGMVYFEISHLFSQWGAVAAPKIMGEKEGRLQRLFGWETEASGEEYRLFLQAFLRELKEVLRKEGVLEQTYFHISDEPNLEQLSSYRAALDGVKEVLKDCKRMDALSDYHFFEEGLVPIPVCATNRLDPFLQKRPKELWCYYCTSQGEKVSNRFIAMPGYRTRVLGAQLYKERLDGFLHWGYNFYNSQYSLHPVNPYLCTDAGGAFPSGDPFIVYPGAEKEPEESIRIRLLDEAFSDFCAMKLLERLTDRETVLACMDPEGELGIADYPKSAAAVENDRVRVNDALRKLLPLTQ